MGFSMVLVEQVEFELGLIYVWLLEQVWCFGVVVIGSLIVQFVDGSYCNCLFWVCLDGEMLYYDKCYLFCMVGEYEYYSFGECQELFEFKGWWVCLLICYDLCFLVWSCDLYDIDLLFYIVNWFVFC